MKAEKMRASYNPCRKGLIWALIKRDLKFVHCSSKKGWHLLNSLMGCVKRKRNAKTHQNRRSLRSFSLMTQRQNLSKQPRMTFKSLNLSFVTSLTRPYAPLTPRGAPIQNHSTLYQHNEGGGVPYVNLEYHLVVTQERVL